MFNFLRKKKKENQEPETLEIKYDINSGIPFRWEYEIENKKICELVDSHSEGEKTREPICGGRVDTTYTFRGLKKGKTKIIFKLINFADNYLCETNIYNIEVDDENNITLISKEEKRMR